MTSTNIEIETKFLLPGPASLGLLAAAMDKVCDSVQPGGTALLHDTYLDTEDWAFLRSGLACRIRRQGDAGAGCPQDGPAHTGGKTARPRDCGQRAWLTLKELAPPVGQVARRIELEEQLAQVPGGRIDRLPGRQLARRLRPILAGRKLRVLFDIHNRRTTYKVVAGKTRVEVAGDIVTFRAGGKPGRALDLAEVELESLDGDAGGLARLAKALARRLPAAPATTSKFQAGLRLAGLVPPAAPSIRQVKLAPAETALEAGRRVIGVLVAGVLWREPGTRLGLLGEPLHQMRVASRRLREALRVFGKAIGRRRSESLRAELAGLTAATGAVRDLDVYLDGLPAMAQRIGGLDRPVVGHYRQLLERRRQRARQTLIRLLDSPGYARLIARLRRLATPAGRAAADRSGPVIDFARKAIRKHHRRVVRDGRSVGPRTSDAQLHQLRLRIKRLRYACEFLQSLFGGRMARFIRRLVEMQDALGGLQDSLVAEGLLTRFAATLKGKGSSMRADLARLIRWQRRKQKSRRAEFAGLWRRFDPKKEPPIDC